MGFYYWANATLLPTLYFTKHYNGSASTKEEGRYLADLNNWRLGPPRLRQLRVKRGTGARYYYVFLFVQISKAIFIIRKKYT